MKNRLLEQSPLLLLAVYLAIGIVLGMHLDLTVRLWEVFAAIVVIALLLWKWPLMQSGAIALCFVVLGALLLQQQQDELKVVWPTEEVVYEAVVLSEPQEKPKTMAVDVILPGNGRLLKCYLYKDARSRALKIGDGLKIRSQIKGNRAWRIGNFDYRRYLEIHGFTGSTFVASWKWQKARVSLTPLSRLMRTKLYFLKLRSSLLARLRGGPLSEQTEEAYAVVAAMALGDKSALTQELKDTYSITGASHVLALSGLHLGIIYTLLSLFVVGRRWQIVSQVLIVVSIWAFVFLVGLSTSVVRSAVMLSVYALLSLGHRDKMSVNTLAFTAMLILVINPLSLYDVGFQMSFMAVFAILVFMPLFERVIPQAYLQDHRAVKWLWGMTWLSLAAQLGVAPLIAYYFGRFSTYFLLTNFIVIPAATLILYLSLVVIVVPNLAYLLLYIVSLLNSLLSWLALLPGASIENLQPSGLQVSMVYVIIASVYLLLTTFFPFRM